MGPEIVLIVLSSCALLKVSASLPVQGQLHLRVAGNIWTAQLLDNLCTYELCLSSHQTLHNAARPVNVRVVSFLTAL